MGSHVTRTITTVTAAAAATVLALVGIPRLIDQAEGQQDRMLVHQAALQLAPGGDADLLERFSNATRQIARRVRPSVVHVSAAHQTERGRRGGFEVVGAGSGWLWDADGHVVTNWHVVDGASRIDVQLHDGELRSAVVVGADPLTDVALIRINGGALVPATRSPEFRNVEQGDLVFAFGSPLDFRFSMSSGLVSGLGRSAGIIGSRRRPGYEDFIQVDAAINPGNSGGPLTDARGRVIGMNTAIATRDEALDGSGRFNGIGLAIPLPMIESVVTQLLETGAVQKGFLGIQVAEPRNAIAELGGPRAPMGVLVASDEIEGLRTGDIVLRCNDTPVVHAEDLLATWRRDEDGQADLEIVRYDVPAVRSATLVAPETIGPDTLMDAYDPLQRFMSLHNAPPGGVVVTFCQPDTPAARCGLLAGDLILRINDRNVRSLSQLRSAISSVPPGRDIRIETWRWSQPQATIVRTATLMVHPDL